MDSLMQTRDKAAVADPKSKRAGIRSQREFLPDDHATDLAMGFTERSSIGQGSVPSYAKTLSLFLVFLSTTTLFQFSG